MVEMTYFRMTKSVTLINGWFTLLNYNSTKVTFTVQGENIYFGFDEEQFTDSLQKEKEKALFDLWYEKEKEEYIAFIQSYLNEIREFDSTSKFEGEIVQEEKTLSLDYGEEYNITVKYENIPHTIQFIFFKDHSFNGIKCHINLPINSKGELGHSVLLGKFIKEETKKRMWDPFRSKTEFRLNLLHKLR